MNHSSELYIIYSIVTRSVHLCKSNKSNKVKNPENNLNILSIEIVILVSTTAFIFKCVSCYTLNWGMPFPWTE